MRSEDAAHNDVSRQNESSRLLDGLNPEQIEAITTTKGYIRVIAGAGTGKTKVLTRRLAYLIEEHKICADNVLSVTFTNKAAREMDFRIRHLIGENTNARVSTFHGFCNTVLREDISRLSYPSSFTIMDEADQKLLIREIYSEMRLNSRDFRFREVREAIASLKKDTGYVAEVTTPEFSANEHASSDVSMSKIIQAYLWKQKKTSSSTMMILFNFLFSFFRIFQTY